MKTGDIIQEVRKKKKLTQKELADKVGMSQQALSSIERNVYEPKFNNLRQIAAALDISYRDLMPDLFHQIRITRDILAQEIEREPTPEEVSAAADLPVYIVNSFMKDIPPGTSAPTPEDFDLVNENNAIHQANEIDRMYFEDEGAFLNFLRSQGLNISICEETRNKDFATMLFSLGDKEGEYYFPYDNMGQLRESSISIIRELIKTGGEKKID